MHGDGRYWKDNIFEFKGEFREGAPKGFGAGFVSYVDPRTKARDRKDQCPGNRRVLRLFGVRRVF